MRFFLKVTLFVLPAIFASATPYTPRQRCPGDFSLEAEWLYFSPVSESRYFALEPFGTIPYQGTRKASHMDQFHSGYRLGAAYAFCDCDRFFSFTWTSFKVNQRTDVSGAAFYNSVDSTRGDQEAPSAFTTQRFNYYAIDAVLGQRVLCNRCVSMDLFAGVHYGHLISRAHDTFNIFEEGTLNNIKHANDFWGVGPEIGFDAEAPIWCGFSLNGNVTTSCLIGKPRSILDIYSDASPDAGGIPLFINERRWRLVPYLDLRLALNYVYSCPCNNGWMQRCFSRGLRLSLDVGYEVLSYFDGLTKVTGIIGTNLSGSMEQSRNVTMHGPFVAAAITF